MNTSRLAAVVGTAIAVFAQQPADACGDKLSMMGGGVSFEMLNPSLHPGRVVMYITPESSLHKANADLRKSLERAGHKVRSVEKAADLRAAVQAGDVDIVLTDLRDDRAATPVPAGAQAPAMLSVIYKPTAASVSESSVNVTCTARVDKARGRQMLEAIENVLAHKGSGLTRSCAPVSNTDST
jgi:hypothetical protein